MKNNHYIIGDSVDIKIKSPEAYRRYLTYLHAHGLPHVTEKSIYVLGKKFSVFCNLCKK